MTATNENFFDSIDGALTPEQAAQAFALAEQGDTGAKPDAGGAPTTTAATDNMSTTTATPTDNEQAKPHDAGKTTTTTGAEGAGTKDDAEVIDPGECRGAGAGRQAHHPLRPLGEGPPGRTALEGLTGKMPTIENAIAGAKRQSKPTMRIVRADDLGKNKGDEITFHLDNPISGYPIMGSEYAEGKGMGMSFSEGRLRVNQSGQRTSVDFPNRLSISSTATSPVWLRTSSAGLSSTTSSEPSRPVSAIISMHSCISR